MILAPQLRDHYNKVDIAIFSPMVEELEHLFEEFSRFASEIITVETFDFKIYEYNERKILITHTGLGTTFTACAITLVHIYFKPEFIFLVGTAGGINDRLKLRDVVIAEKAFEAEIQGVFTILKDTPFESCLTHPLNSQIFPSIYEADRRLLNLLKYETTQTNRLHLGTVVSSNTFPAPVELFEKLKAYNPICIDMETSAFYQISWLLKIPALAVRGISNILNADGTDDHIDNSDVKGSAKAANSILLKIISRLTLDLSIKKIDQHSKSNNIFV